MSRGPRCLMAVGPASTSFRHPPLAAVHSVSELLSLATLALSAFADGRVPTSPRQGPGKACGSCDLWSTVKHRAERQI